MAVTQVGTPSPQQATGTGSPAFLAGVWGTGQTRTAGNLLVALVTAAGTTSAAATAQHSGTTGWTKAYEGGGTFVKAAIWTKTAAGTDAAPSFDSTIAGTSARCRMSVTLFELDAGNGSTSLVDTGNQATGTSGTLTVTTAGNVAASGEYALAVQVCLGTSSGANTWGTSGSFTNDYTDGVTTYNHWVDARQASPASGSTLSYLPTHSFTSTGTGGAIAVFKPGIPATAAPAGVAAGTGTATGTDFDYAPAGVAAGAGAVTAATVDAAGPGVNRGQVSTIGRCNNNPSQTTVWGTNPAAGSTVLVFVSLDVAHTVADNGTTPVNFTQDVTTFLGHGANVWRGENITLPGAGQYTVTVTVTGGSSHTIVVQGVAYTGLVAGAPVAVNTGSATSVNVTTNAVTGNAGGLYFGGFSDKSSLNPETITFNSGAVFTEFSRNTDGATYWPGCAADAVIAGGGSQSISWTLGDSVIWGSAIAVYDAAGAAATSAPAGVAAATGSASAVPLANPAAGPATGVGTASAVPLRNPAAGVAAGTGAASAVPLANATAGPATAAGTAPGTVFDYAHAGVATAAGAASAVGVAGRVPLQQVTGSCAAANNTPDISFTSAGGTGLIVFAGRSGGTATGAMTGVVDSAGNTWALVTRGAVSGVQNTRLEMWACANANAVTTVTLQSATSQVYSWLIMEWDSLSLSALVDVASADYSGQASSSTIDTPQVTPGAATDLVFAAVHYATDSGTLNSGGWTACPSFDDATGSSRAAYIWPGSTAALNAEWLLGAAHGAGTVTVAVAARGAGAATSAQAGVAAGAGTAAAQASVGVPAGVATGDGAASAVPLRSATAGPAAGTGAASAVPLWNATTGPAGAVGAVTAATISTATAGQATAGIAGGAGSVSNATVLSATLVQAGVAAGTAGTASAPAVGIPAGIAAGTGAASAVPLANPAAGAATGTGAASAVPLRYAPAGVATGTGVVVNAATSTVTLVSANAGVAAGSGAAPAASVPQAEPSAAAGTGAAPAPTVAVGARVGVATGTGAATAATMAASRAAGVATGAGTTAGVTLTLAARATAQASAALAAALSPGVHTAIPALFGTATQAGLPVAGAIAGGSGSHPAAAGGRPLATATTGGRP